MIIEKNFFISYKIDNSKHNNPLHCSRLTLPHIRPG